MTSYRWGSCMYIVLVSYITSWLTHSYMVLQHGLISNLIIFFVWKFDRLWKIETRCTHEVTLKITRKQKKFYWLTSSHEKDKEIDEHWWRLKDILVPCSEWKTRFLILLERWSVDKVESPDQTKQNPTQEVVAQPKG